MEPKTVSSTEHPIASDMERRGGLDMEKEAVHVFPEEVWGIILEKLGGDAGSMNACNETCTVMKRLLAPRKLEFQLLSVFPFIKKYLDNDSVRKCRLVCRTWQNVVDKSFDKFVPAHFYNLFTSNPHGLGRVLDTSPFKYRFADLHDIRRFTTSMTLSPTSNPFITKCVVFSDEDEDSQESSAEMWQHLAIHFLPVFGRFISSCKFEFSISWNYGPRLVHVILLAALKSLSHLENLSIDFIISPDIDDYSLEHLVPPFLVVSAGSLNVELKHLKTLCMPKLGFLTTKLLLTKSLEELTIDMNGFNLFPEVPLPNLKFLSTYGSIANFTMFGKWRASNLKKMHLEMNNVYWFKTAEVFKQTLIDLEVNVKNPRTVDCLNLRVDLPNLINLKISIPENCFFYDFLLSLRSLKTLEIVQTGKRTRFFDDYVARNNRILQIKDFEHKLYWSNVWSMLPSLNHVFIHSSSFSFHYDRI